MDQTIVQRHAIDEWFENRSRRSDRIDHIYVAETAVIIDIYRAYPATHFHGCMIHDDHRQRTAGGQA